MELLDKTRRQLSDPMEPSRLVYFIRKKAKDYRCTKSYILMTCPVKATDGLYYERSILEAHTPHTKESAVLDLGLQAKIAKFSKESLVTLKAHLKHPLKGILELTAECLAVVILEYDSTCWLLKAVEGETELELYRMLRNILPLESMHSLLMQLSEALPSKALSLARVILIEALSKRAFDEAFMGFVELLSLTPVSAATIDLTEEVSARLSTFQLGLMNSILKKRGAVVQELRVNKANMRMRESLCQFKPDTRELPVTFVYSYRQKTNQLYRTNLLTQEESCHMLPSYMFKRGCCWTELSRGTLFITGGGFPASREVVRIDTLREFAVCQEADMVTPRRDHAGVYYAQHLYILGGRSNGTNLYNCERYVCAQRQWQTLPSLPYASDCMSGAVVKGSLFALSKDRIYKLNLEALRWEFMDLLLPDKGIYMPCFLLQDTKVYFLLKKTIYSFSPDTFKVMSVKTLRSGSCSWNGASSYSQGTLYCPRFLGPPSRLDIGLLD
jgi:hypothetical protein